jgi:LCP family protein required for cell wall assembly
MRPRRRLTAWLALVLAALMVWDLGSAMGVPGTPPEPAATIPASGPIFLLFLGSDARPGEPTLRRRSDVMLLVGINRAKRRATILAFNRDTWVPIRGHDHNRINTAMVYGGPSLAVHTVTAVTGITIHAWLVTTFQGFTKMVDGVGGVDVAVPFPMYDPFSTAAFEPGWQRLSGSDSLAFVRDRHGVPDAVDTRTRDHGRFAHYALEQYQVETRRDRDRLRDWVDAGMSHMRTNLSLAQIMKLAGLATRIPASRVNVVLVPDRPGYVGDKAVVFLRPAASRLFADMRRDGIIG